MDDNQEMAQAYLDQERMVWDALDNCYRAGAPVEDLKFLAWQSGVSKWSPPTNVIQLRR